MAEHKFDETVDTLFKGLNQFMTSKTVVGEPIVVGDTMIVPLIDVSFGMGAGANTKNNKASAAGGAGGKMSPNAVLVIKNDNVKIMPVSASDPISKIIDMAPELINKITGKGKVDPEVKETIDNLAQEGEKYE